MFMLEQSHGPCPDDQPRQHRPFPADDSDATHVCSELLAARALDQQLVTARRVERGAQHRLATLLAEMADSGFFRILGYTSVERYAELVLEIGFRMARDLVRIGRSMSELPVLNAALAAGEVDYSKAREVVRVATPETDHQWTERAKSATARQIERDVSFARRGDVPPVGDSETERKPARRRVTFEMDAAEAEVLFAALAVARGQMGLTAAEVEDGAVLAAMAQRVLHDAETGESPSGARHQIILHECVHCRVVDSPEAEVSDSLAAEAACSADRIDMRAGPTQGHATRAIAPVLRRKLMDRAKYRCEIPECTNRFWLDIHHVDPWARAKKHVPDRLLVLCAGHHRAIHNGYLAVELSEQLSVRVEHADGRQSQGPERNSVAYQRRKTGGSDPVEHRPSQDDPGAARCR